MQGRINIGVSQARDDLKRSQDKTQFDWSLEPSCPAYNAGSQDIPDATRIIFIS